MKLGKQGKMTVPSRVRAMDFLLNNYERFPVLPVGVFSWRHLFEGWGFTKGDDDTLYFADCINPGICEDEFLMRKAMLYAESCAVTVTN